jgi:alpha-beta hydrolase superfamily lysophospholipase
VLRSARTHYAPSYSAASDRADTVLDVRQIARWAGCLGGATTVLPVEDARHDVFLSLPDVRKVAYQHVDDWLRRHRLGIP